MSKNKELSNEISIDLIELLVGLQHAPTLAALAKSFRTTQPSISRKLQQLSRELGLPLFVDAGRKKILSATAREMCARLEPPMEQIRAEIRQFRQRMGTPERCRFKIGGRLEVLSQLIQKAPLYPSLTAIPCESDEVVPGLLSQKFDIGLSYSIPDRSELVGKKVAKQTALLGIAPSLLEKYSNWKDCVRKAPCLIYRPGIPFLEEFLTALKISDPSLSHAVPYWPLLIELARQGKGWLLFPSNFQSQAAGLSFIDVGEICRYEMEFSLLARKELFSIPWFKDWFRAI